MCIVYIILYYFVFFFFKQKTAYELRISDWSSDVCSSDLPCGAPEPHHADGYASVHPPDQRFQQEAGEPPPHAVSVLRPLQLLPSAQEPWRSVPGDGCWYLRYPARHGMDRRPDRRPRPEARPAERKSTRLNSNHSCA